MKPTHAAARLLTAALFAAMTSITAFAQRPPQMSGIDISGAWFTAGNVGTSAGAQVMLVEYEGIPMSEACRLYALTWNSSRMTSRQQQCAQYDPTRLSHGGGNQRFWEDRDPFTQQLIAIKVYGQITEGTRTIWMDGRPHPPPYAKHTFLGFSTGKYEGNVLTVYTTHIKRNWIRLNGQALSDESTLIEHFIRHGERITYVTVLNDPVFLAEPLIRSTDMLRSTRSPEAWLYACDDGEQVVGRPVDQVPNYLFGKNPYLHEYSDTRKVPMLAALGGPETMYPQFLAKLKSTDPAAADAEVKAEILPAPGPPQASRAVDPNPHDGQIHVLPVQGNLYMFVGDGGNIAVQTGVQGAFVVDTGAGKLTDKVVAEIRKLIGQKPIQFAVNTSFHPDYTGGNVKLHDAGADPSLLGSFFSAGGQAFADAGVGATMIAHQNVQNRMSEANTIPSSGWPTDTFLQGRRRKYYNDEGIEVIWEPNAATDGDTIVHFRRSDVIVTGDIFNTTQYPFIDVKNGGSVQGEIAALDNILDRTIYQHLGEGGTLVIPGHGRLCDEYEVSEYRDMLAVIRDRVQAMVKDGASVAQVKAARLTADYDTRFGAISGPWTTDMFVEAVYSSLKQPPQKSTSR